MKHTIPIQVKKALQQSWDKQTCYPADISKWSEHLPETGQCAVTALLINDLYGGKIVFNQRLDHYWNILPDGKEIDLTKKQFTKNIRGEKIPVTRQEILHSTAARKFKTNTRYLLLKRRVESLIQNSQLLLLK
ncbi:YunG family protein [Puia sp. P3]|uniref:YunG family protein n=1 Tax=Puia sp. P3 TaxID=3423952 RepID=UPI003D66FC90